MTHSSSPDTPGKDSVSAATADRPSGLPGTAIGGVPWTFLAYATNKSLTVTTTVVLAYFLAPGDFGVVALATLVIAGFNLLSNLGVGNAMIIEPRLSKQAQGTILTLMLMAGVGTWALVAALSPLVAKVFDDSQLTSVVAALSVCIFLMSFVWFYDAVMQRELHFRSRFVWQSTQNLSYAVIAICLGAAGAGVWSLVIGQIASWVLGAVVAYLVTPERVSPTFNAEAAKVALARGRGFLAQSSFEFLKQNVDYIAVGRLLGATSLGWYAMAYRLGELPYRAIAEPISVVMFPNFARMRSRSENPVPAYLLSLRFTALLACPVGVIVAASAHPFTEVVFDDTWLPIATPLSIFGIWAALRAVEGSIAWFLNGVGLAGRVAQVSGFLLLPMIIGLVLAAKFSGITAVAWVMLGHIAAYLLALAYVSARRAHVSLSSQARALAPAGVGCAVAWMTMRGVLLLATNIAPLWELVCSVVGGVVAYVATLAVIDRQSLASAIRYAGRLVRRESRHNVQLPREMIT